MKRVHLIFAFFLLSLTCAYGQMIVISAPAKDPEVKPDQQTANIVHYLKMRATARSAIRILALALENEEDIVDWANWCIVAFRDKTPDAKACVFQPDLR
jgi:hypothetical protein